MAESQGAAEGDGNILEGYLCPFCMIDLKSPAQLTQHFEALHQEDQNVIKSIKSIFGIAKKKILNLDESELKETFDKTLKFTPDASYNPLGPQEFGSSRSLSKYFKDVRKEKMDKYAAVTNNLLIRLDNIVSNMPQESGQRKQHEQKIVPWLDGSLVKLCPGCAKGFNLARRQHHCRLCGSILCHDCSFFFDINIARCMMNPSLDVTQLQTNSDSSMEGLRLCEPCFRLIDQRKQLQDSRNSKTVLVVGYEQMRSLMKEASPAIAMYVKMCASLRDGETTFHLSDANAVKSRIAKYAEGIDSLSKQIAALQIAQPGSKTHRLQNAIRQAAIEFIKTEMLSLVPLPTEAEILEIKRIKKEETERRIENERRQMQLNLAKRQAEERMYGSRRKEQEGWTVRQNDSFTGNSEDDPCIEQMNILRGYIQQAREELRFEEVAILEQNLKELKTYYLSQSQPSNSHNSETI